MEKNKVSFKQSMTNEEAVNLIQDLVDSLKVGKIVLEQNDAFVSMTPGETVAVEIEGKQKKDKGELSIELAWRIPEGGEEKTSALKISATEPEVTEAVSEGEEAGEES